MNSDYGEPSLLDLFRTDAEAQVQALNTSLLALERDAGAVEHLDACMRAAHSIKGAARIVGFQVAVRLAHALEDCFVAAQRGELGLDRQHIDALLAGTDLLAQLTSAPTADFGRWVDEKGNEVDACVSVLARAIEQAATTTEGGASTEPASDRPPAPAAPPDTTRVPWVGRDNSDRVLRVSADVLNRLLGLAGESLVESRWVKPFAESLLRLKRMQMASFKALDEIRSALTAQDANDNGALTALAGAQRTALVCQQMLSEQLAEIDTFDLRLINLSHRLYDEVLACRMRPFADGVQALPRMVRDLARSLGKEARLEIAGESTPVDRDILLMLDGPLGHLLSNAVDHGLESPEARLAAGKPAEGLLRLEARHSAGALQIIVADDGAGVDLETVRARIVARNLLDRDAAGRLRDSELLEFLFLPGFSMKDKLTRVSGRGVGLDVVQTTVRGVRGAVHVSTQPGHGTQFVLQLPVTLSILSSLVVEVRSEPYAFALVDVIRALNVPRAAVERLEGRHHFTFEGRQIGLITAHQVLGVSAPEVDEQDWLSVVVIGQGSRSYGLVVDRFVGEHELVVRALDPVLGKIKDVAAGAIMKDGSPVLIVDTEDLLRSIERLASVERLNAPPGTRSSVGETTRKRVLVVDDSLTVREVERKLLANRGYDVEVAVDGMDGWNAVKSSRFDLVVTDIDMPRMDGIELVTLINRDPNLKAIPVMVVSYKDREEDRQRGFNAGAAYYLTKGSFHDDTLLQAVVDLIGEAAA